MAPDEASQPLDDDVTDRPLGRDEEASRVSSVDGVAGATVAGVVGASRVTSSAEGSAVPHRAQVRSPGCTSAAHDGHESTMDMGR